MVLVIAVTASTVRPTATTFFPVVFRYLSTKLFSFAGAAVFSLSGAGVVPPFFVVPVEALVPPPPLVFSGVLPSGGQGALPPPQPEPYHFSLAALL